MHIIGLIVLLLAVRAVISIVNDTTPIDCPDEFSKLKGIVLVVGFCIIVLVILGGKV